MIGQTISHYKILSKLGAGGMGVVYEAEDLSLQRRVALKFLPADAISNDSDRSRLVHEARAAAALLHPNICPVYEIGESEGRTFIAMAYLEGCSLRDRLREDPLPVEEALRLAKEVAEALSAAHAKGIIHRDVKPGNVMVTPEGRAMLMDFGLARMAGSTKLTRTGATVGTAAYMSPEQMQGKEVDARTDIWSLGVMLYEMVSGRLPFEGEYEPALFYTIANEDPKPLAGENVPAGLDGILAKSLAKRPTDRYQTVRELIEDIDVLLRDRESLPAGRARRVSGLTRAWWRWRWWERAAAVTMMGLVAAAIVYGGIALLTPEAETIDSIGVLPLKNLTGNPGSGEITDGLVSVISASLGSLDGVQVRSPRTMMMFKESNLPMAEIGRQVKAKALIEGSYLTSGNKVHLTIQVYKAAEDKQLYAHTFSADLQDLLALPDEIARGIAGALDLAIRPGSQALLVVQRPVNPAAIEAYTRGLSWRGQMTVASSAKAIEFLTRAVAIDSTFARGYAALAFAYSSYAWVGILPAQEAVPKAKQYIDKALALDPNLPEALGALADYKYSFDGDFAGAEELFQRTFELDPNLAVFRNSYAFLLVQEGDCAAAVREAKLAKMLDPMNAVYTGGIGIVFHDCASFDSALVYLNEAVEEDSTESWSRLYRSSVYATKGMYDKAVADMEKAAAVNEQHWALLAAWYVNVGDTLRAKAAFKKVLELAPRGYWNALTLAAARHWLGETGRFESSLAEEKDPGALAFAYCCLGRIADAFTALERGYEDRPRDMVKRINSPWLVFLKRDARYTALSGGSG